MEFARLGWRIALIARTVGGLRATLGDIKRAGGEGLILPADVSDEEAVQGAADAVAARWDAMDVWVNNAMVTVFSGIAGLEPNELAALRK
jgi:NAD(P)-dependent dehydrogenase (short-subunit alcohol dehydrogenase family)